MKQFRLVLKREGPAVLVNVRKKGPFVRKWFSGNTLEEAVAKAKLKYPNHNFNSLVGERN